MTNEELIAQNTAIRRSMADTATLLDKAYGSSGERLELRVARLIRIEAKLRAACLMAREELVFGGDWETASRLLTAALSEERTAQ